MNPMMFKSKRAAQKYVESLKDLPYDLVVEKHVPGRYGEHWGGPEYVIAIRDKGEFIGFINEF